MNTTPTSPIPHAELDRIYQQAVDAYVAGCRARIKPFVREHFGYPGTISVHRAALGYDMAKVPANILLAIPNLSRMAVGAGLRRLHLDGLRHRLHMDRHWQFRTAVEREIQWLIYSELLDLPFREDGGKEREHLHDGLADAMLANPEFLALVADDLQTLEAKGSEPEARERIARTLREYSAGRTPDIDIALQLLTMLGGGLAFKELTPGAMAAGSAAAAVIANHMAIANFWAGTTIAQLWYGAFPASASLGLVAACTGGIMLGLGVLSAFAGVVTDPLTARLGLHERRLRKLVDSIETTLRGGEQSGIHLKNHYIARLGDIADALSQLARIARA